MSPWGGFGGREQIYGRRCAALVLVSQPPPAPPVPLTGVGFFDCFRLKPMIRNQLAKHLGFITRKGRGLFLVIKQCQMSGYDPL